jgi:hypothetical protein
MSEPLPYQGVPLPPDARRRIADVCARFDAATRDGHRPRIEDYLPPDQLPAERRQLLKGLLEVEFYYRRQAGQAVNLGHYEQRFPDHADAVGSAFLNRSAMSLAASAGEGSRHTMRPRPAVETAPDPGRTGPAQTPSPAPASPDDVPPAGRTFPARHDAGAEPG